MNEKETEELSERFTDAIVELGKDYPEKAEKISIAIQLRFPPSVLAVMIKDLPDEHREEFSEILKDSLELMIE